MISHFQLFSVHPECSGSIGNALRQCMGTRCRLSRAESVEDIDFITTRVAPVALFIDLEGLSHSEVTTALSKAAEASVVPVLLHSSEAEVETEFFELANIWTVIETRPEGRFRRQIQTVALEIVNYNMLKHHRDMIREGFHKTIQR